ncbi:MAG: hypothetical protein K2F79_03610, partial [Muribaculaceae bacterium]|nr:hypothetical protein [Muribaculaceae bacterium]
VHNVFDAAWWRPEEEKKKVIESQRLVAYNEIRSLGFGIELAQCFCINLGQVRDFRSGDYPDVPQLAVAAADFDLTEEQLYKRIISNRDTIRLTNCLKRVTQQRDRLVADIRSELGSRQELLKEYERTAASLAELDKLEFRPPLSFEPDINLVAELAGYECGEARAMIADGVRKNTTDARSTVVALLTAIENAMTANVARIFPLRRLEDDLYSAYRSVMAEIAHKLSGFKGYRPPTVLDKIELSPVLDFTLSDEIDVESLVPSKHLIVGLGGHKSDAVRDYLNRVEEVLVTSPDHLDQPQNNGRLIRNVVPRATAVVEREIAHAVNSYAASIASAVKTSTEAVLDSIIPGLEAFQATTARLGELASRLEALKLTVTT